MIPEIDWAMQLYRLQRCTPIEVEANTVGASNSKRQGSSSTHRGDAAFASKQRQNGLLPRMLHSWIFYKAVG